MRHHDPRKPSDEIIALIKRKCFIKDGKLYKYHHSDSFYYQVGSLLNNGYSVVYFNIGGRRKAFSTHHIVWLLENGEWPSVMLDHKDRRKVNNRIENLREGNNSLNALNIDRNIRKRSGLPPGVAHNNQIGGRKYTAKFHKRYLGAFANPYDAWLAYCKAYEDHYGNLPSVPNYLPIKVFNTAELDK